MPHRRAESPRPGSTTARVQAESTDPALPRGGSLPHPGRRAARATASLAAIGLLALGATACDTSDAEPATASSTTSTPSPAAPATTPAADQTTTPPPSVPAPDPADYPGMDQQTEEGAKQSYKYYWALVVYGYASGDTAELERRTLPECSYCKELISDIQQIHADGGGWSPATTEEILIESASDSDVQVRIDYGFSISAHTEAKNNQSTPEEYPLAYFVSGSRMSWDSGAWKVAGAYFEKHQQ